MRYISRKIYYLAFLFLFLCLNSYKINAQELCQNELNTENEVNIIIPKEIKLAQTGDSTYSCDYEITIENNELSSTKEINICIPSTIEVLESETLNKHQFKQKAKIEDIDNSFESAIDTIDEKICYKAKCDASSSGNKENIKCSVLSDTLTAGDWCGTISFSISIKNISKEYGIYKDGNLLKNITREDIEKDYSDGNSMFTSLGLSYGSYDEVIIPEGTKKIGKNVFYNEQMITDIDIPESVEEIDKNAFCQALSINKIVLPKSLKYIEPFAFLNCGGLKEIVIGSTDEYSKEELEEDGLVIGNSAFLGCYNLKSVTFGNNVVEIDANAFKNGFLTDIKLPKNLRKLGDYAFSGNSATSLYIPKSLIDIGSHCFYNCYALSDITFEEGVLKIGDSMFDTCPALKVLNLPDSIECIDENAFANCSSLSIYVPEDVDDIKENAFLNVCSVYYNGHCKGSPWGAINLYSN